MLVIHPKDRTTAMLQILYEGLGAQVITGNCSNREMGRLLHHAAAHEHIMLLGHGTCKGLYYRKDDTGSEFDKIIVGHPQGYLLRKHIGNVTGIWCNAVEFAKTEGLHGLFSGMIISEMSEAEEYGVATGKEDMDQTNRVMFSQLRSLLDDGIPLYEIPERLKALDHAKSELSRFNYENFFYL